MKLCNACNTPTRNGNYIGSVLLCEKCAPNVNKEIDKMRAEGKPVNAVHIARKIYRENNGTDEYLFREIPSALWSQAKHRAVEDKDSLRDLLIKALYQYLGR